MTISRPARRAAATVLAATLAVAGFLMVPGTGSTASAATTAYLPFDLPAPATLRATPRKVFAHYFPPLPVSIDNQDPANDYYARNYLNPNGESGKHAAYGGHLRDRPLTRPVRPESSWRVLDMEAEVRQAIAGGIDGFTVNLIHLGDTGGRLWVNTLALMDAAARVDPGFKIVLMPDISGGLVSRDAATMARWLAHLGAKPSAYRLPDGRLVVAPFHAESWPVSKWKQTLDILRTTYNMPVAFVPTFLNERVHRDAFAPISYGMGNWGSGTPQWNNPDATGPDSPLGRVAAVRNRGKIWMQPVRLQDARPNQSIFDESLNTTNLRNTWEVARRSNSEWVQLTTWNDYTEGSSIASSVRSGPSFTDLNAYYATWLKTGKAPTVVRDAVYLTHRKQPAAAKPTFPQTKLQTVRGGVPTRDAVEALSFLRAPGTVTVKVGSRTHTCAAPAGVGVCTVPLSTGTVSASVTSGSTVTSVTSRTAVTATPYVQDLTYLGASSLRTGTTTGGTAPAPTATPTKPTAPAPTVTPTIPAAPATTVTVRPLADSYANEWAATANYRSSWSLAARGTPGYVSYLRFALPATPPGHVLKSASLRLRTNDLPFAGSADAFRLKTASNTWHPSTLTWQQRPRVGGTVLGAVRTGTPSTTYTTRLSTAALAPRMGTQQTFALTSTGSDDLWFWSGDHGNAAYRPALRLTYEPAPVVASTATSVSVQPVADTYANRYAATTNYGTSWSLASRGSPAYFTQLRFNLPVTPAGKTVTGARLRIRTNDLPFAGSAVTHWLRSGSNSWTESGLTYANRPPVGTTALGAVPAGTAASTTYDVPLHVPAVARRTGTQQTFVLSSDGSDDLWLWSGNHGNSSWRPTLTLTYG